MERVKDMNEPIRVLNVTRVFKAAGIESFIMNMYRNIDRSKVQFDFLIMSDEESCYDEEIYKLGGRKYTIDIKTDDNIFIKIQKEAKALYDFLKEHEYKIIHIHYTTPLRAPYLLAAKKAGLPVRIYHSHSAEVSGKSKTKLLVYNYYRKKISKWATDWFACSNVAADWMFSKKLIRRGNVNIVYNGIDIKRFKYDENSRKIIRNELGLANEFVIIHTGRFIEQKNHKFVLEVFQKIKMHQINAKLLLLGTGDLFEKVKDYAHKLNIIDSVFFLGVHTDIERYLSAADCYIMPSLYEGLPVAAIEAECSGLPCFLSTNITREVALTDLVKFLDLSQPAEKWSKEMIASKSITREDKSLMIKNKGYDVRQVSKKLQKFYENAALREK